MQAPLPPAKYVRLFTRLPPSASSPALTLSFFSSRRIQLYCGHDLGQEVAHQLQSFVDGVKPLETVPMGSLPASLPAFIREQVMLGKEPRGIALAVAAALPLDPFFDVEGRRCPQPGHGPLHARVWCPCHMQSHSGNVGMTGTGWWRWAAVQAVRGTGACVYVGDLVSCV